MTNRVKTKAASRAVLATAFAGGMWAMIAPGGAFAGPGMEGHHQPESQPPSQSQGGCGSGCGDGGSGGHHHGPLSEQSRDARDRAARGAAGDDESGGVTVRSGGRPGEDLSGQIGATAAAQGAGGSDDPSAALSNYVNAGVNAGKNMINAGVDAGNDLIHKAESNALAGPEGTMFGLDKLTDAAAGRGNGPAKAVPPAHTAAGGNTDNTVPGPMGVRFHPDDVNSAFISSIGFAGVSEPPKPPPEPEIVPNPEPHYPQEPAAAPSKPVPATAPSAPAPPPPALAAATPPPPPEPVSAPPPAQPPANKTIIDGYKSKQEQLKALLDE